MKENGNMIDTETSEGIVHLGEGLGDVLEAARDRAKVRAVIHVGRPTLGDQFFERRRHHLAEPDKAWNAG